MPVKISKNYKPSRSSSKNKTKSKHNTKAALIGLVTILAVVMVLVAYLNYLNYPRRAGSYITEQWHSLVLACGFELREIYVIGNRNISQKEILNHLKVKPHMPMTSLNPWQLQQQLEAMTWVSYAEVDRILPSTLHLHIVERQPLAYYQQQQQLTLIDSNGQEIVTDNILRFKPLPIIIGAEANLQLPKLYRQLNVLKLWPKLKAAIRVSERRWNLEFYDLAGTSKITNSNKVIQVKLADDVNTSNWQRLAELVKSNKLFGHNIAYVDLRIDDKIYTKYRKSS
ncbi:MAG: FtsQ-type POTRA domain-containing protein [Pseudomonadota bacterium]